MNEKGSNTMNFFGNGVVLTVEHRVRAKGLAGNEDLVIDPDIARDEDLIIDSMKQDLLITLVENADKLPIVVESEGTSDLRKNDWLYSASLVMFNKNEFQKMIDEYENMKRLCVKAKDLIKSITERQQSKDDGWLEGKRIK